MEGYQFIDGHFDQLFSPLINVFGNELKTPFILFRYGTVKPVNSVP